MARSLVTLALLALLSVSAAPSADAGGFFANPVVQFNDLVAFLGKDYPSLLAAIVASPGLVDVLNTTVQANTDLTILAPRDSAFAALQPCLSTNTTTGVTHDVTNTTAILKDHVIPKRLGALSLIFAAPGSSVATLGTHSLTKLNWFLKVGIKVNDVVVVSAKPTHLNIFWKSRIVVHGIDTVLAVCPTV